MATYTQNINLKMPEGTERVSRTDLNENIRKIDAAVSEKLNKPTYNSDGTSGQVLYSEGGGNTRWGSVASEEQISSAVTSWLNENVPTGTTVVIDKNLTLDNAAAGAKATGDALAAVRNDIAPRYSSTGTYAVGDYCMQEGQTYRCIVPIESAENFTASHWVAVDIANDLEGRSKQRDSELSGSVSDLKSALASNVSDLKSALASNVSELKGNQSLLLTSTDFVNGEIQASTGNVTPGTATRLMTIGFHAVSPLKPFYWTILPGGTFSIRLIQYDESFAYITGGNLSSRTVTLDPSTRYVRFVLWDGSTAVSPSDVTSVSFDTYANDVNDFPDFVYDNIPDNGILHVTEFVAGQYYDSASSGNIKVNANKSRSKHFYKLHGRYRLLSVFLNDCEIVCYNSSFAYIGSISTNGLDSMPANTEYVALTVNNTSVDEIDLYLLSRDNMLEKVVKMDIGGIEDSNGKNAAIHTKNPHSYRRTTKYLRIREGTPFRITFTGTLYVYEYASGYWFIQKQQANSGQYYFPNKQTILIKLESYVAPSLVNSPSINIGYKYISSDRTQWLIDSMDTDLCYSNDLTLDSTKKYLISRNTDDVALSLCYSRSDGTPLNALPFGAGDRIVDCLSYLRDGEKVFIRADTSNSAFSSSDRPFSVYEITENTVDAVSITQEWPDYGSTAVNKRYGASEAELIYEVHPIIGDSAPSEKCYTSGLLKLPPNYDERGKPVPLIYFAHGSSDYTSIDIDVLSPASRYGDYIQYLCDEGYAVFDCYGWSNLMSFAGGGQWGGHIAMACATSGIAHVVENYNVDPNRVYVTSKSLGGLQALNMATFGNVRAVAPLAPAVDSFEDCLGYNYAQRKAMFYDFGLDAGENDSNIDFISNYMYNAPEAFMTAVLAKPDALVGYNPAWNAVYDIDHSATITAEHEGTSFQSGALKVANILKTKSKFNKVPVKIWCASDDTSVSYRLCSAYVTAVKKGGGIAELRTMPDGTGGHHSVDNDPNAPKVASITTALGITHTNVPVAYVEMVQWFRQYE